MRLITPIAAFLAATFLVALPVSAQMNGTLGATSTGSIRITFTKYRSTVAPAPGVMRLSSAGWGRTTRCVQVARQGDRLVPGAGSSGRIRVRAAGRCAGGSQAYRVTYSASAAQNAQGSVNLVIRPE